MYDGKMTDRPTPGPWTAAADSNGKWCVGRNTPGNTDEGEPIGNTPIAPTFFNAVLIAAAPELLDALIDLCLIRDCAPGEPVQWRWNRARELIDRCLPN